MPPVNQPTPNNDPQAPSTPTGPLAPELNEQPLAPTQPTEPSDGPRFGDQTYGQSQSDSDTLTPVQEIKKKSINLVVVAGIILLALIATIIYFVTNQ